MKKRLGNLLLFITSLMCVIVLFGCVSINSKAARKVQPVQDLKFINNTYHFKTVTDGYYFMLTYRIDENGDRKCISNKRLGFIQKNETIDKYDLGMFFDYNYLGKTVIYIVGRDDDPKSYSTNIGYYENDSKFAISSYSTTVTEKMPKPTVITTKWVRSKGEDYWVVSWASDGNGHVTKYYYGSSSIHSTSMNNKTIYNSFPSDVDCIYLRTSSSDLNKYANSDAIVVYRPDKNSSNDDQNASTQQTTATVENNAAKLPMTVTVDDITYVINTDGTANAIKIASKKKAVINAVTVDGKTYPVVSIADNACKNNKKIKTVSIGSNVTSIGKKAFFKCKKLKKVTIKANKSLKIGKGAFKKISKGAAIKIKGVKGNARKRITKEIRK